MQVAEKPLETPIKDLDYNPEDTLSRVPLDDVEKAKPRSRYTQLLAVIVAGVALFSDGYNIQVTGETRYRVC